MNNENEGSSKEDSLEGYDHGIHRAKGLVAADVTITKKAFSRYAAGSIKNTSGQTFSYLVVKVDLLDANGKLVGNASDGIQNLEPGTTWDFEAGIDNEDAETAQVHEIRGWL